MLTKNFRGEMILARAWPGLVIGAVWLWLCWPMMAGQTVVGFRDSAYLYYPLFKWIDAQWAAGEVPLWNPYCNFGMPVVADGTSSVFYPGKLVFFFRFLSYPSRYGIYLAMHLPLAAAGTYWLARTLKANRGGATLAAVSFAFGGSVLFQVTNVVYLVSAAWLPFAMLSVWRMIKTRRSRWAVLAGVCCAMMILGGDPQMVYHVGLIAAATITLKFCRLAIRGKRSVHGGIDGAAQWLKQCVLLLMLMVAVTCLLAAVQLLPTYRWTQRSERATPMVASNIYQGLGTWLRNERADVPTDQGATLTVAQGLLGEPIGTANHAYQFSQPPWTIAELIWPNISGKPFPQHQRWTNALAGADRIWVPSLYLGVLTALLALGGLRLSGRRRKQVWLTSIAFFFTVASFGWYGLAWLVYELFYPPGEPDWIGPQVGGIYWLMNVLLPKYFMFRYPAKLFVIASLALSVLAGINLRRVNLHSAMTIGTVCFVLTLGLLSSLLIYGRTWLNGLPEDRLFGPFDSDGAFDALVLSLVHSLLVVGGFSLLAWWIHKKSRRTKPGWFFASVVALSSLDICVANSWLTAQVEVSAFEAETQTARWIAQLADSREEVTPVRIMRSRIHELEPANWQVESSHERLAEIVAWDRESLSPKWHLGQRCQLLGSFSSIWPRNYEDLLATTEHAWPTNHDEPWPQVLGSDFHAAIVSASSSPNGFSRLQHNTASVAGEILRFGRKFSNQSVSTTCRITKFTNQRIVAEVNCERPSELLFLTINDSGWRASVRDQATGVAKWVPLETESGQGLCFWLPIEKAGQYEIELIYRPNFFWIGAWVSGLSWFALLVGVTIVSSKTRPIIDCRRWTRKSPDSIGKT